MFQVLRYLLFNVFYFNKTNKFYQTAEMFFVISISPILFAFKASFQISLLANCKAYCGLPAVSEG